MDAMLEKAKKLAKKAHENQTDKAGKPYLGHALRVMEQLEDPEDKIVGVLHDAVEDSPLTLAELEAAGFPRSVTAAVDAITKREGEDYEDYLGRVMSNPRAIRVKIADMTDNMDMGRIPSPTDKDWQRLRKYQAVLPRLKAALVP